MLRVLAMRHDIPSRASTPRPFKQEVQSHKVGSIPSTLPLAEPPRYKDIYLFIGPGFEDIPGMSEQDPRLVEAQEKARQAGATLHVIRDIPAWLNSGARFDESSLAVVLAHGDGEVR
jgi:hypothetical protein